MRRIAAIAVVASAMVASAIIASASCSPGFAQSLRASYSPDGTSAASHETPKKQSAVHAAKVAPKVAPSHLAIGSRNPAAQSQSQPQTQAQTEMAMPPPPSPNRGVNDFFAAIFAGPIMFAHALRPAQSYYPGAPSAPSAYAPQAYAAPSQEADHSIDPKFLRQTVAYSGREVPGTIIVDTTNKFLYLIERDGTALRYGIGVGRPGFLWSGTKTITAKREWPDWIPPAEMLARRPDLPRYMPGGVDNPLGARALYLGSSLYRIHGSNEPWTIGTNVSSGCIRMRNEDVTDLYGRVKVGTKVIVI
jgi:lipoprotein-anchoring transpeptidase ErfK/SrfK